MEYRDRGPSESVQEIKGLVSITVPIYNSEHFLEETIESVLAQTYKQWELFLVDDGSTDRSPEIARAYTSRSPNKVQYLEHPEHRNLGVNFARNLGAKHGQGELLAFLDSDDVWLPDKLEKQVALLNSHQNAGLVYGPCEDWWDWNPAANRKNHVAPIAPGDKLYFPPTLLLITHPIGKFGAPCGSSFLVRRSAFDYVGGFDESFNPRTFQVCEDTAFLTKLYLNFPVYITNDYTERYRCRASSMWHSVAGTSRAELALRFYFHWLRQYLKEHSIRSSEIWWAVRRAAWMYWSPLPVSIILFVRRVRAKILRWMRIRRPCQFRPGMR